MHNNLKAISWMLIHVITAALLSMHYRILGDKLDELQISFFTNITGLIFILPIATYHFKSISYFWRLHLVRSFCTVLANLLLIYAYNNMPFAQVSAITLTYPLFSTLVASIFLGEKIGISRVVALLAGFAGALVIINPNYNDFNYYAILVLLAMCLWIAFDVLTRTFPNNESVLTQSFYALIFTTAISLIPVSLTDFSAFKPELVSDLPILGLVVALYIMSGFFAIISPEAIAVVMPFYFLVLVMSIAIGYYVFDEALSLSTVVGSLIILSSTTYIALREYRVKKIQSMQKQAKLI